MSPTGVRTSPPESHCIHSCAAWCFTAVPLHVLLLVIDSCAFYLACPLHMFSHICPKLLWFFVRY
ncbi:hypothetical protein BD309DRAFT_962086 [Dichomitus squalens]|nr:hypothetical protein BD309DRAFT_962086 [Dichomitus squalens]